MIRRAGQKDVAELVSLLRSLNDALPRFGLEPFETTFERVSEALKGHTSHTVLVAEDAGHITGFVHTHWQPSFLHSGGKGFVSALFVHADRRGWGLGRAPLEAILEEGRGRGCSRLLLLNMRHRPSYERGFYTKLGWRERPEAANFVYDLGEN